MAPYDDLTKEIHELNPKVAKASAAYVKASEQGKDKKHVAVLKETWVVFLTSQLNGLYAHLSSLSSADPSTTGKPPNTLPFCRYQWCLPV